VTPGSNHCKEFRKGDFNLTLLPIREGKTVATNKKKSKTSKKSSKKKPAKRRVVKRKRSVAKTKRKAVKRKPAAKKTSSRKGTKKKATKKKATRKKSTRRSSSRKKSTAKRRSIPAIKSGALPHINYRTLEKEINRLTDLLEAVGIKSKFLKKSLAYLEREQNRVNKQISEAKRFLTKLKNRSIQAWRGFPENAEEIFQQLKSEFNRLSHRMGLR